MKPPSSPVSGSTPGPRARRRAGPRARDDEAGRLDVRERRARTAVGWSGCWVGSSGDLMRPGGEVVQDMSVPDQERLDRGEKLAELVLRPEEWVHRRVERIEVEPTGDCIRHVSLDFTLPDRYAICESEHRVIAPMGVLRKGALHGFDLTGPSEKPTPMLEATRTGEMALELITSIVIKWEPSANNLARFTAVAKAVINSKPPHNNSPSRLIVRFVTRSLRPPSSSDEHQDEDYQDRQLQSTDAEVAVPVRERPQDDQSADHGRCHRHDTAPQSAHEHSLRNGGNHLRSEPDRREDVRLIELIRPTTARVTR